MLVKIKDLLVADLVKVLEANNLKLVVTQKSNDLMTNELNIECELEFAEPTVEEPVEETEEVQQ